MIFRAQVTQLDTRSLENSISYRCVDYYDRVLSQALPDLARGVDHIFHNPAQRFSKGIGNQSHTTNALLSLREPSPEGQITFPTLP